MNCSENIHVQKVNEQALQEQLATLQEPFPLLEEEALEKVVGAVNEYAIPTQHSAPPSPVRNSRNVPGKANLPPALSRSVSARAILSLSEAHEHADRKWDMDLRPYRTLKEGEMPLVTFKEGEIPLLKYKSE